VRAPSWVAPHQPRLDWQLWFAALGSPEARSLLCTFQRHCAVPTLRCMHAFPYTSVSSRTRALRARLPSWLEGRCAPRARRATPGACTKAWRLLTGAPAALRLLDDASPWRGAPPRYVRVMRWHQDFTRAAWGRPRLGPRGGELAPADAAAGLWRAPAATAPACDAVHALLRAHSMPSAWVLTSGMASSTRARTVLGLLDIRVLRRGPSCCLLSHARKVLACQGHLPVACAGSRAKSCT